MTGDVRVGICDDDALQREGLAFYVRSEPDLILVKTWPSGTELLRDTTVANLDILLLDVRMPTLSGPHTAMQLHRTHPGVRVLFLTSYPGELSLGGDTPPNVMGALVKDLPPTVLASCIRGAAAGVTQLGEPFRKQVIEPAVRRRIQELGAPERDQELLEMLAAGATNRQIARAIFASESTVKQRLHGFMEQAGVDNRVALVLHLHGVTSSHG